MHRRLPTFAPTPLTTRTTATAKENRTLFPGPMSSRAPRGVRWNPTEVTPLPVMAPLIVVFLFARKVFIEGVTLTGVKG
ncbi:hypothetical protein [Streptosporangium sp. NPDC006930]|uniref:hypothetical protein n=1 Tax=unclassified Streptosporangium TaxID=2632669 RepID=UPI003431A0CC